MYRSLVDDRPHVGAEQRVGQRHAVRGQHLGTDDARADAATGLLQLSGLVQGLYARISQRHDLTPVQARLLCMLADGPRGMAQLAHCFGVEKAALTGLVDRVERRGLARRMPVPDDRRALHVTLTGAGRRAATAFHVELTTELGELVSALDPQDQDTFRRAVAVIIARCGAIRPT
jgi:DNA-binding MarR family transcriptional regulator